MFGGWSEAAERAITGDLLRGRRPAAPGGASVEPAGSTVHCAPASGRAVQSSPAISAQWSARLPPAIPMEPPECRV